MKALVDFHDALYKRRTVGLWDDFTEYTDTQRWTKLATGTGASVANSDNVNGLLTLTTGATGDNEAAVATTRKFLLMQSMRPIVFETRLNYQESDGTNLTASLAAGVSSTFATGFLANTTGAPVGTFSGAAIYKSKGDSVWSLIASVGTTQLVKKSDASCIAAPDQILRVEISPVSSTLAEVAGFVNGVQLRDPTTLRPIKHTITYTGALKMAAGVFLKTGAAASEVANVDYIAVEQLRGLPQGG